MNFVFWTLVCLASYYFERGYGILCYHCHQTTKECNNGAVNSIRQKNCTEDRCAVMKYETPMPGRKVLATLRDCASLTEQEFVHSVSIGQKNLAKIIIFQECFTPLCNQSSKKQICTDSLIILFAGLYFFR